MTPMEAVRIAEKSETGVENWRSSTGLYTNKKGIIKPGAAIFIAFHPTENGLAFAIPAAVYEAIATGGVMFERHEK